MLGPRNKEENAQKDKLHPENVLKLQTSRGEGRDQLLESMFRETNSELTVKHYNQYFRSILHAEFDYGIDSDQFWT